MIVYVESGGTVSDKSHAEKLKETLVKGGHEVVVISGLRILEYRSIGELPPELNTVDLKKTIVLVVGFIDTYTFGHLHLPEINVKALGNFFDKNPAYDPDLILLFTTSFTNPNYVGKINDLAKEIKGNHRVLDSDFDGFGSTTPRARMYDGASDIIVNDFKALQNL